MIKILGEKVHEESVNAMKIILNCMDALLYVSNFETGELLFLNDRMKDHLNIDDNVLGKTCWKVLQKGLTGWCDNCPIDRLRNNPDEPIVWQLHNTITGRVYRNTSRIIEWIGGVRAHLLHATDITDILLTEASLEKRLRQQELMSAISHTFTTGQETGGLIVQALKMSGEFMGVNQSFLSKYHKDKGCLECLYEWCDDEGQPFITNANVWPISPDMDIYKNLMQDGYVAINDFSQLDHPNFKTVSDYNLRAFINFPLEVSGEFWGIIGFIINERAYNWSESDIHLGMLIASVLSGEISRSIVEENLFRTMREAEQSSRAKGEFLSHMSHEMRTPMNAIIGMTKIARESGDLRKMEYCLEKVDGASKHLLGLINDVLDMSKIEANKFDISLAEFDFEKMLINTANVLNLRIEEKKQDLIINIGKDVNPSFIGDEIRLRQVITNLLSNSIKFAPTNSTIALNVHNTGVKDGVSTLLFEVVDNGIGISKEQQKRMFDPFEQAADDTFRNYGGTGLGLPISKGIVEMMGGRIWIESELGHGSKFSFTVNLKIGKTFSGTVLNGTINKMDFHALVVSESANIREYFTRLMSGLDLSCDTAVNDAAALEMVRRMREKPYNIIFLDWNSPYYKSKCLAKKIKDISTESKIIVITFATDWNAIDEDSMVTGIDQFVFKPLFASALVNAINESMGTSKIIDSVRDKALEFDFRNFTLLIAEDIEINREIIAAILEKTGVNMDFAHNGVEAVRMYEQNPGKYDLILMDIQMPGMDGYEAVQCIRASTFDEGVKVPILAMTANVFREDIEKCTLAGMNDHIGKPINAETLFSVLGKYLV